MKDLFHGYYKPTEQEFSELWENAKFSLDANVLLNLYTYSSETTDQILRLFNELQNRLWLPYQSAKEFHQNRVGAIRKELKRYEATQRQIKTIKDELTSNKKHPFVEQELLEEFLAIGNRLVDALRDGRTQHFSLIRDDRILDAISGIFDGRVGDPFSDERLEQIYKEGAIRFKKKMPPGYEDAKKPEPDCYGDLVIWKELIAKSETDNCPVLFIVDDLKEDWWEKDGDDNLGPRPELRHEFKASTGFEVYFYSSDQFVRFAKSQGADISDVAQQEIEESSKERAMSLTHDRNLKTRMYSSNINSSVLRKIAEDYERVMTIDPGVLEELSKRYETSVSIDSNVLRKIGEDYKRATSIDSNFLKELFELYRSSWTKDQNFIQESDESE